MMNRKIKKAVLLLTKILGNGIKWAIIGSTALILHGMKCKAKDVDIITTKRGIYKVADLLRKYEISKVYWKRNRKLGVESLFCRFSINGVKVEVMGPLQIGKETLRIGKVVDIKVDGFKVPIATLPWLLKGYRKFRRKRKAKMVENYLKSLRR